MRGQEKKQTSMLVLRSPEDFVPKQHPIRHIEKMADESLQSLSPTLEAMYADGGPSIPPERRSGSPSLYPSLSGRSRRFGRGRPPAATAGGEDGRGWAP